MIADVEASDLLAGAVRELCTEMITARSVLGTRILPYRKTLVLSQRMLREADAHRLSPATTQLVRDLAGMRAV